MPADWPDFPHHAQICQYFNDYVDHFGLRETITFNTAVTDCERLPDGRWRVTLSTGETRGVRRARRRQRPPLGCAGADLSGHVRWLPGPLAPLPRPVRAVRLARQERHGRRGGQLGDGHLVGAVAATDRGEAVRLDASRRVGAAEVLGRQAGRQGVAADVDAGQGRPGAGAGQDQEDRRPDGGLRPAQARPRAARRAPVGVRRVPHARRLRRHHAQARDQRLDGDGVVFADGRASRSTRSSGRPATTSRSRSCTSPS